MTTPNESKSIRPSDLARLIECAVRFNGTATRDDLISILIAGAPGAGKSAVIGQTTAALGADLIVTLPALEDPINSLGLPWVVDGVADFIPFGQQRRLLEATRPTVWLIEDLGMGVPAQTNALCQWIHARSVNGHDLPDCVTIVAATNRTSDNAGAHSLPETIKSRFSTIVTLEPDRHDWIQAAVAMGLSNETISFLELRSDFLNAFEPSRELTNSPSPRTIHQADKWIRAKLDPKLLMPVLEGAAGRAYAIEFSAYLSLWREMIKPSEILADPINAPVPTKAANGDQWASLSYALSGALASLANGDNAKAIVTYAQRMAPPLAKLCMVLCSRNAEFAVSEAYRDYSVREGNS